MVLAICQDQDKGPEVHISTQKCFFCGQSRQQGVLACLNLRTLPGGDAEAAGLCFFECEEVIVDLFLVFVGE